jgi:NAD(P)-dependent dehydrogenase (short-subunit alcohol dehydrogenase family)
MAGRLKGKVAIVTGAAPRGEGVGNGMATAILFAREGAKVVLVNRSAERAEKLAKQIKDEGGMVSVFAGDVVKPDVTEAMAEFTMKTYGRIDILHNNVGIGGVPGTPETVALEGWNTVLETNLTSTMLCTKACLPRMKQGGGGSIIMVSSIAGALGLMGSPGAVAYATSKAGLHGFTLSVAADHATQNIRANCIIVGSVFTPMASGFGEEARQRRINMVPMQTEGTGWDVAHGAVYLASDESRWVTGLMLPIDGGLTALRAWPR